MNHGDHANCGLDYETDESTVIAFCPHCGERFEAVSHGFTRGQIVRHTSKALKSIYGNGGRGAPVNGRIVGTTGSFPLVQWSDGHTGAIAAGAIEPDKRAKRSQAFPSSLTEASREDLTDGRAKTVSLRCRSNG